MYKLAQVGNDMTFLHHVRKFIAASKKHRVSLGRERTICPCNSYQNKHLQKDIVVQSHLIRRGFIKNYTILMFHDEGDPSVTGASERNSSMTSMVNERGQQPSSSTVTTGSNSVNRDYINIDELLQDMACNDGDGHGDEQGDLLEPEDADIFENHANRMDQDDVLFGNSKWPKNFKEMKHATIDPLYKDSPKH